MRRRDWLQAIGALMLGAGFASSFAQEPRAGSAARVAFLDGDVEAARARYREILIKRLGELGYVEGRNLVVERRFAGGDSARLPSLAAELVALKPDVLVTVTTTVALLPQRQQIVEGARRLRLPAIHARQEYTEAGGLLSYGADPDTIPARGAEYVARILRGAKPSEMPFEMASTFRLVLNARTADALGIKEPPAVRARADEVIQ